MKTLQDQYKLIKEGKGHKGVFLKEAKQMFPNYIRNAATFEEASNILKDKNVISENLVGLEPINTISRKKESYETAFENFLEEARKKNDNDPNAEIKKVSQQVEDKLKHNFDRTDKKNPDNQIFGEIMKGYYCEMKDPKNANKTEEQLRDIVLKNLAKDPIYYTKNGMFGEKGVGVEMDVPGLGEPKELKGKYKSSGYGDLKEGKIKRNYPNFLDSEYQGETIPMTGDELYTFLVDTMAISRNVDDFIQKVTYGLTDETSTLSSENEEKLRNWWDKNYNMNESIDESKVRKLINTMIKQELISENKKYQKTIMEIEKASKLAELTTKMEALGKAIEEKNSRLNSIEESEDLKELVNKLPEFSDPEKATQLKSQMRGYLNSYGFQDQEISQIYDHRIVMLVNDAMKYRNMQKLKPNLASKIAKPGRVLTSGMKKDKSDVMFGQRKEKLNRLKKSGNLKDATNVFLDILNNKTQK